MTRSARSSWSRQDARSRGPRPAEVRSAGREGPCRARGSRRRSVWRAAVALHAGARHRPGRSDVGAQYRRPPAHSCRADRRCPQREARRADRAPHQPTSIRRCAEVVDVAGRRRELRTPTIRPTGPAGSRRGATVRSSDGCRSLRRSSRCRRCGPAGARRGERVHVTIRPVPDAMAVVAAVLPRGARAGRRTHAALDAGGLVRQGSRPTSASKGQAWPRHACGQAVTRSGQARSRRAESESHQGSVHHRPCPPVRRRPPLRTSPATVPVGPPAGHATCWLESPRSASTGPPGESRAQDVGPPALHPSGPPVPSSRWTVVVRLFPPQPASLRRGPRRDMPHPVVRCARSPQTPNHVLPHADGGPTSAANGQGLLRPSCNLVKEDPGWTTAVVEPGPGRAVSCVRAARGWATTRRCTPHRTRLTDTDGTQLPLCRPHPVTAGGKATIEPHRRGAPPRHQWSWWRTRRLDLDGSSSRLSVRRSRR